MDKLKIFNEPISTSKVLDLYNNVIATGANDLGNKGKQVFIYPNPFTSLLNINLSILNFKVDELSLINYIVQNIIHN